MINETRYRASREYSPVKVFSNIITDFPKSISLGYQLSKRNIKARYRKSFFGVVWAFLPPLATAFVWIVLQKQGLFNLPELNIPYPLFVLTGTFLWQVFVLSFTTPIQTVQMNQSTLVKINFPREALFFAALFELLFNACISFAIIIVALVWYGIVPGPEVFYFLPYFIGLILLGLCFSLFILPFSLLFTDIQFMIPFVLQFAMYLTPVIYPKLVFSGVAKILEYNPVAPFLSGARSALLGTGDAMPGYWFFIAIGVLLLLIAFGLVLMRITMSILIERMGS